MAFDRVIGHDRLKGLFSRALKGRRLPPAMLLAGPEGVGKRMLAMEVARALLCQRGEDGSCESCPPCHRSARGLHPDLFSVGPESGSIKIDRVRDMAREISGRPFEGPARAFVFDDAHLLTEQAGNALLKSLEEPPASSHVFLVSASPQALLPTIRSRCQTMGFGALPVSILQEHLQRTLALTAEEARLRAVLSGGSLGTALRWESESFRKLRDELLRLLDGPGALGILDRMEAAEWLDELEDLPLALTVLRSLLRDVAALRSGVGAQSLLNADLAPRLHGLSGSRLGVEATRLAEAVGQARQSLRANANRLLAMDTLLEEFALIS